MENEIAKAIMKVGFGTSTSDLSHTADSTVVDMMFLIQKQLGRIADALELLEFNDERN